MQPRKTKIVATLGPASNTPGVIKRLVEAGMNVARLNFSHGTHAEHGKMIRHIREVSDRVAVLQDLQGPRIRTGKLAGEEPLSLEAGRSLTLTTEAIKGTVDRVAVTYPDLPREIEPGMTILINDGMIQLEVEAIRGTDIACRVVVGGRLGEHKGINVPEASISIAPFTEKDRTDLAFGIEHGIDFVGMSFVKCADDIERVRECLKAAKTFIPIVAKIERREAVANLADILDAADGVMVARGDLGIETSSADVPIIQKRIIALSNAYGKFDITATQMLESMVRNPRPTRAEACDVANAIFDGTDAVMLSGETATGRYPVHAVETMAAIATRAEQALDEFARPLKVRANRAMDTPRATALSACLAAKELEARALVVFTESGRSAIHVSQCRPEVPIIAFTPHQTTVRRLAPSWGVLPLVCPRPDRFEDVLTAMEARLVDGGIASQGDLVVITAGSNMLEGATNTMRILRIGETTSHQKGH